MKPFFEKVLIVGAFFLLGIAVFLGSKSPETPLETNEPPKVASLSSAFGCGIHNVAFFWRFSDPDENDIQAAFQIQIDDQEDFSSPLFDSQKSSSFTEIEANYSRYDLPEELVGAERYFWRIRIWDNKDASSDWSRRQILPL